MGNYLPEEELKEIINESNGTISFKRALLCWNADISKRIDSLEFMKKVLFAVSFFNSFASIALAFAYFIK